LYLLYPQSPDLLTLLIRHPQWRPIPSDGMEEDMEEAFMENNLPEIHEVIRQLNDTVSVLNQSVQQLITELKRSPYRDMNAGWAISYSDRNPAMTYTSEVDEVDQLDSITGDAASNFRAQNVEQLWREVLNRLREHMSEPSFVTWFGGTKVVGHHATEHKLVVSVPTMFVKSWIENHYREQVTSELRHITGEKYEVEFVLNYEE
jgi:DnaA N-terminal domain